MSSQEYRLIPQIALDYKTYEMVDPDTLATKMSDGWTPIAVCSWTNDAGAARTRFIVGKDRKEKVPPPKDPRDYPELRLGTTPVE